MTTATMTKTSEPKKAARGILHCPLKELRLALAAAEPAVPDRTTAPVLRNVRLCEGRIHATNNEMWISAPAGVHHSLDILLPFARLKQIVAMSRGDHVLAIQQREKSATLEAVGGKWSLPTEPPESFPFRSMRDAKPLARLPADQFHDLLKSVVVACAKDAGRYSMNGVLIDFTDGVLSFVASDGRRMCVASCEIDQSLDDSSVLVPRKAVDALLRLAALSGERAVQLASTNDTIVAWFIGEDDGEDDDGGGVIIFEALTLSGPFPKWRKAEKQYTKKPSRTPAGVLLNAVEMCAVCSSETSRGITMTMGEAAATFTVSSSEYGKAESMCGLSAAGDQYEVTFDPRLATDWLAMLDPSEPVQISGEDAESPITLESINCRCLISPISKE
jgi:DNA polymerase-3 subunit beta